MTFEDMGKSIGEVRDNQLVQAYPLGRTEANLDRLEAMVERNELQIEGNSQAIQKIADGFILLQAAMKGMTETVDRFIRGMEHNGHHPQDYGPEGVH